jgi:MoaA/NifB/PqqE/SkfB family radical SAM enzyme
MLEHKETWGKVLYDTSSHRFITQVIPDIREQPYVSRPLVLNVDLTFKCNMRCEHCVAKDLEHLLGGASEADLRVTEQLIDDINQSPFMVVVITGGEPLLPDVEPSLATLLEGLKGKGVIVDTNGTLLPSHAVIDMLREKQAMVRVSWDSLNANIECRLRKYPNTMYSSREDYMEAKQEIVRALVRGGLSVAVQTVVHKRNDSDALLLRFPHKLRELGVRSWYIQRFIPSHKWKDKTTYDLGIRKYEEALDRISREAERQGVACYAKRDRRHNSVFLLVKNGELYTQSEQRRGAKVHLGNIANIRNYFEFVSLPDHTARYL